MRELLTNRLTSAAFSSNILGVWNSHISGCLHLAFKLGIWIDVAHSSYYFSLPHKEDQIWDSRQLSTDSRLHDSPNVGRRDGDQTRFKLLFERRKWGIMGIEASIIRGRCRLRSLRQSSSPCLRGEPLLCLSERHTKKCSHV